MSESDFLAYQRATARGLLAEQRDGGVGVQARLFDERDWPLEGRIDFIDNQVDRGAGTIRVRAVFDNPTLMLTPGQFGRLRLPGSERYTATLVPDSAIVSDQSNKIVLTVAEDGTVVPKPVRPGPIEDGLRIIRSGLEPTDRVIISGIVRARPGTKVTPQDRRNPGGGGRPMKLSHLFIERPIFATVLSILITLIGGFAYFTLPVAQYPEIAPPTIVVNANYPGASAEVVADTLAAPLEQEINGVENMLYMSSQSTGDGRLALTISFALGTDLDTAQVLVQNRVAVAEPRLPEEVRRLGVTVRKNSPDMLMVIHLSSPDESRDQLYISNYATLQVKDVLARLDGIGDVQVFGARDYAMRIWLDPDRVASRGMTAGEVVAALCARRTSRWRPACSTSLPCRCRARSSSTSKPRAG